MVDFTTSSCRWTLRETDFNNGRVFYNEWSIFMVHKKRSYIHTSPLKTCQKHVCPPRLFNHLSSDFSTLLRMGWHPSHLYHRESFSDVNVRMSCTNQHFIMLQRWTVVRRWAAPFPATLHSPSSTMPRRMPWSSRRSPSRHLQVKWSRVCFFHGIFFGRSKLEGGRVLYVFFLFSVIVLLVFYFIFWQHEERVL